MESLYTVGGNINWSGHYRKQFGISLEKEKEEEKEKRKKNYHVIQLFNLSVN